MKTLDVLHIYILPDDTGEPRSQRLSRLAAEYAAMRGLPLGNFIPKKQANGKPYFPEHPQICFSVSHSGTLWAAAFYSQPVGIDIQRYEDINCEPVAKRWFAPEEYDLVCAQGKTAFFAVWCAKESFLKQSGLGISDGMGSFSVVKDGALATTCDGKQIRHLPCPNGYHLAVCAEYLNNITVFDR